MKQMQNPEQKRTSQDRIRELIAEYANGSQQEFCDACGVAKSSISQYVNRTNSPGNITAAKIASRYGLNPLWIMGFDVPKILNSDAENFRAFADNFNQKRRNRIIEMNLRDKELSLIEKYRKLDLYGIDMVDTVIEKELDRCVKTNSEPKTFDDEDPIAEFNKRVAKGEEIYDNVARSKGKENKK